MYSSVRPDVFRSLFYPRGVAVIGSVSAGKLGHEIIRQMLSGGFAFTWAVNPKGQGLLSVPGFTSVSAIGQPVDLAVIASPAATVPEVLHDCGRAGVSAAVIITAGFAEVGNSAAEEELVRIARRHDIRFVGPNCAGILNTRHRLAPMLEVIPPDGATALISQSGALGGAVLAWAEEQGLGFSKFVSYGNRADLDEADLLRYLADDPETKVVAMYIESVGDGREFMAALAACTRRKPVVVIKAGRSSAGRRATLSHTGSLAGSDAVYDAALRECGALRVRNVEELFDLCKGFSALPPMSGRRIAIVTNSGGPGVLAADRAEEVGLDVAEPGPALRAELASFLPAHCAIRNPFDLTVEGDEESYRRTLTAVLGEYDGALALDVNPAYLDSLPLARGVADAIVQSDKPVVVNFMAGRAVAAGVEHLRGRGISNYPTAERAVAVLVRMAEYHEASRVQIADCKLQIASCKLQIQNPKSKIRNLTSETEPAIMAWLRENGIPTPPFQVAETSEAAVRAARAIGYPVVLKVVSPEILHKTEVGGVKLDIRDDAGVLAAFAALAASAAGKEFHGAIIYPLIRGAHEALVGLSYDPQFGPVVAFGLGGIYTELLKDVALRVAPVDRDRAREMICETRAAGLLIGARGQRPADLDALAALIARVSELPFLYPEIAEVDLNPVFVSPDGVLVGDARVIRRLT
ncbi:MAG: acetate--CoA ligase family protein [Chloroflexi bacterium]|nr:acetate--CoA ligase family protein [Chloroflexota bacterium]